MTMLTEVPKVVEQPESIGSTKLAYISDSEKKVLRRREAMLGYPGKKVTTQGIPVLADSRADIIAHAKGLGIADVPDANVSKRAFKQFTERLNAAKTAQRTGEVGTEGEEAGLKRFVQTPTQKTASSKFYESDPGKTYAAKLGKPEGFGIRKIEEEDDDPVIPPVRPRSDPTVVSGGGFDINAIFDESKLNQPLLEEIVLIGPRSEVLQERLKDLINTNSPLFKAATTKALQSMNRSGLGNSSIAQEAVMAAILQVAIPIAERDASAFMAQRMANQDATNAFRLAQNQAYYQAFMEKLTGSINTTLRQLSERSANWRSILQERGAITRTPGMSADAAANALRAITPTWF